MKTKRKLTAKEYQSLDYAIQCAEIWFEDFFYGPERSGDTDKNRNTPIIRRRLKKAREILEKIKRGEG